MGSTGELAVAGVAGLPAGMLGRTTTALAEREQVEPAEMAARVAALAGSVAGEGATPLERLLAERVAVCLIDADRCDARGNWPAYLGPGDLRPDKAAATALRLARMGPEALARFERQAVEADRARSRSYRRLAQAVRALADARGRPAVLAVSLNVPPAPREPTSAHVVVLD